MFLFRTLTLQTGPHDLLLPLILRGASLGMLFVPLTLATLAGLPSIEMAEGTSIYNLSRQLGGSAGIAFLSTFINHRMDGHYATLAERVNVYNPMAYLRLQQYQQFFMSKGSAAGTAWHQGLSIMQKTVLGQAALMSYTDAFILMGIVFAATLPLLLLFEKRSHIRHGPPPPAAE